MMPQREHGPTTEAFEPLRTIDLKRAGRLEPTLPQSPGDGFRQWMRGVAHNELSLRVQPVLPDLEVEGDSITAIDRGEITSRSRGAIAIGVLCGWITCVIMFGLINGSWSVPVVSWGVFAAIFIWLLLPILAWCAWYTRRGRDITRNTLNIQTDNQTASVIWERTDGCFAFDGTLDDLVLGLYMVEIYAPRLPRALATKSPMTIASLPMETHSLVDRGWIAIALLGDLWLALGIDRTPEALRDALQPLRDAGLEIDEDPTVTVRGFGVRTLLPPDRERFSRKK